MAIGLFTGGIRHNDNYSFLTKKKFRNPRPFNKAAHIEAKLVWADSTEDGFTTLDSPVDLNKIEKVKYIPQNFLETLCVNEDESEFENEIKKIIFSHTSSTDRLGFSNLDDLISYKSEIINKELTAIKGEIDELNQTIINLERKSNPVYKRGLNDQLTSKTSELESHKQLKPNEVLQPKDNPELEERNREINEQIASARNKIKEKQASKDRIEQQNALLLKDLEELNKLQQTFNALQQSLSGIYTSQEQTLGKHGINIKDVFSYKLDTSPIQKLVGEKSEKLSSNNLQLSGSIGNIGIEEELSYNKNSLVTLEQKLDEPYRLYQKYLTDLEEWSKRESLIQGDESTPGTIIYLEKQIKYIDDILPSELIESKTQRNELIKKMFSKKQEIISLFSTSYKPITDFIGKYGSLMKDYQINLSVEHTLDGFVQKFFDHISQGARGTYIGIEEGNKFLNDLLSHFDLNTEDGIISFLEVIIESLSYDQRPDQGNTSREIEQQLKKGYSIEDLYRFLFNLEYLKPTFKLNLGTKSLGALSPGERGALLLIFYLFLDKDDRPLIIDQPEENLDNQSVYNYLVDFIKEAKRTRQVIIVTHNPNLAVVCDAEQIIHMTIDKANNYIVSFQAGSIENSIITKTIVDILEGTKPAFNNRTNKYSLAV